MEEKSVYLSHHVPSAERTSKLGQLMTKVSDQTVTVKSLMLQVSAIRIDPKLLLTSAGAQSVVKKMALLGDLAIAVALLGRNLETTIQRL